MQNELRHGGYLLSECRVLDLTDDKGFLCGRILADLGAEVVKLEQPCGDPGRQTGPFYHNNANPEQSLLWFAYNANKKGITLDINTQEGQSIFYKLLRRYDIIVESFSPGYLEELGLGYADLRKEVPNVIMASITPFGQNSDMKHFKATDLVGAALGGMMYVTGDPDREPLRVGSPQSYLHASSEATVGILIAIYHRILTGEGQYIDCSMFRSWVSSTANSIPFWELNQRIIRREGKYRSSNAPDAKIRQIWRCKDGYICFAIMGGAFGAKTNRAICDWMEELGEGDEFLREFDWDSLDFSTVTQELQDKLEAPFEKFFTGRSKSELFEKALQLNIQIGPVSTLEDLLNNRHLKARGYWQNVEHTELGDTIVYPGDFAKFSVAQTRQIQRAPLIGEHNEEIYINELGFSREELESLSDKGIV